MKVYDSILELIGSTPLLRLHGFEKAFGTDCRLYAKLEYFNPAGSAKDRPALQMILDALEEGKLKEGGVIIEPTSGNTGIGLCLVAAKLGFKAIIVMPDTMSKERIAFMKAYGAEVVLTDGKLGMKGAIAKAEELRDTLGGFIPDQFGNPSNAKAHYLTTGPEIYDALEGQVDCFIAGIGTGGTVTGVGKYLKEKAPDTFVVGIEPLFSPLITKGYAGSHRIQGIGANFVPSVYDGSVVDEVMAISDEESYRYAKACGGTEGFLCGISSGAVLAAAKEICSREEMNGKNVVLLFPDGGDRYLSSDLC